MATAVESSTSAALSTAKPAIETANQRLFNLRLKLNQARYDNKQAVIDEDRRQRHVGEKSKKEETEDEKKKEEEELKKDGVDPEKEKLLNATVLDAEWIASRKKKRKQLLPNANDPQIHYNAYKKRVTQLQAKTTKEEYEKAKEEQPEFYREADSLAYGTETTPVPGDKVERMVEELQDVVSKRAGFSRRRTAYEEADVDYINSGNRVFNQKIAKAFNKYTVEIKQNLERGTAI